MRIRNPLSVIVILVLVSAVARAEEAPRDSPRPNLQVINGSDGAVDVFWLKSETERVPNGAVLPGKSTIIATTIGHRFVIVSRADKLQRTVTSIGPVQAFRFEKLSEEGIPPFYTQVVRAHGYPIVASSGVSPFALKEAAYLVDQMLGRRPDVRTAMIE
ncbi:MAG: hypothetical protein KA152_17520, partial [Verrucomicrobiales bacterium]|nr:hypothetical protein [Verrucomicrobiales bacterium]